LNAAQPAAGTAFQGARSSLAGRRFGLEAHVDHQAQIDGLDVDPKNVVRRRDRLGQGEAARQILDIGWRRHQHRMGSSVERQADGDLVGHGPLNGL
jgi:hypothetical protein